jgi:Right handed beta helix region
MKLTRTVLLAFFILIHPALTAKDYYVHPELGNDGNDGSSKTLAIKTLERAGQLALLPGDRILLAAGKTHYGSLQLRNLLGEPNRPILVESVNWNDKDTFIPAIIDSKGMEQGILIEDCKHLKISLIKITANGYAVRDSASGFRTGVMIKTNKLGVKDITLDGLKIYDVFYENQGHKRAKDEVKTANGTERYGWGIRLINNLDEVLMDQVLIQNCEIENIDHTGIKLIGKSRNIQNIRILKNKVTRTGGPGIQMSNVRFVYVAENAVTYSGSHDDSRKWGRGSGLWTWSASNILIEKNKFMYAHGPGDSAGAHIDYNCDNVILQYNFSAHNAGGFCEVLGNNYNCAYRYNISVNDGHRVKGEDGAFQEGKMFWLSGYQGNNERKGPVNTYFYNNTIFVDAKIATKIAIDNRSEGILIANNIFYIVGESSMVKGDQYKPDDDSYTALNRVFFQNNLFFKKNTWPADALIQDNAPLVGDPQFSKCGGLSLEDYIPANKNMGKGIEISLLPGDEFGLINGLKMKEDILGNKIIGTPGIGAINY